MTDLRKCPCHRFLSIHSRYRTSIDVLVMGYYKTRLSDTKKERGDQISRKIPKMYCMSGDEALSWNYITRP